MDDENRLKLQATIIAAGLVIIIYQFLFNWGDADFSVYNLLWGIMLGIIVGAITFGVMTFLEQKKK